jgi:hypothetical protein
MTYTARQHADTVTRYGAARGDLGLYRLVEAAHGSGVVLTTLRSRPEVLGLAALDSQSGQAALALSEEEVAALRDALEDWLYERRGHRG